MEKIKVMIVDDHAILRMGLASLLNAKKDIEVIGEANSGAAALKKAPKLKPDVIVMDLMMPEARILILTTFGTADGIAHALAAGAMGAVLKSVEFVDLANAIRKIAAGEKVIDQEIRRFLRAEPAIEPLSPRQREILDAIVNGLSNADISARFGISLDMVKEHNQKLFEKLGVSNRAEAIAITLRKHLLKI